MGRSETELNNILTYLSDWRSASEIKHKFRLSQTEHFNLMRWLIKAGYVTRCSGSGFDWVSDKRTVYYKTIQK